MRNLLTALLFGWVLLPSSTARSESSGLPVSPDIVAPLQAEDFRNDAIRFARATANHLVLNTAEPLADALDQRWNRPYRSKLWALRVSAYRQGKVIGSAVATAPSLATVLRLATIGSVAELPGTANAEAILAELHFVLSFDYLPDRHYDVVEYDGHGLEWLGERSLVKQLDAVSLNAQIQASKHYLLRMQNPEWHAWYRFYDARRDRGEDQLRTIYTASSLLSLLHLNALQPDPEIQKMIRPTLIFLHSMQWRRGPQAGAFRYSMNARTGVQDCRLMAGTTSKTIFTMLQLQSEGLDSDGLAAARRAGDWLLTLVTVDGRVLPKVLCQGKDWKVSQRQSLLYSGQVLSALSRLYAVTKDARYYVAATRIADRSVGTLDRQHGFVGDDYRLPNSISTSWVAEALNDYVAINPAARYRDAIDRAMTQVLWRQILDSHDRFDHGRFLDTMSSSGNGWINEVMGVLQLSCIERAQPRCDRYLAPMVASSRWLLQNSYNAANSLLLVNPLRAEGGMIGSIRRSAVRTDAVGHALNGLMSLAVAKNGDPGPWLQISERRFDEVLILLRALNGAGG